MRLQLSNRHPQAVDVSSIHLHPLQDAFLEHCTYPKHNARAVEHPPPLHVPLVQPTPCIGPPQSLPYPQAAFPTLASPRHATVSVPGRCTCLRGQRSSSLHRPPPWDPLAQTTQCSGPPPPLPC